MFGNVPPEELYATPPKRKEQESEVKGLGVTAEFDCISFGGSSGTSKFVVEDEEVDIFIKPIDTAFRDNLKMEVSNKAAGIRNILDQMNVSIGRLKEDVDALMSRSISQIRSQNASKIQTQESAIWIENPNAKNIQQINGGVRLNKRSCTKSCSKLKTQTNKYQDNEQFKAYQCMLKCIIVQSPEKIDQGDDQNEKQNNREPRRKLDFDTDEEFMQEQISTGIVSEEEEEEEENDSQLDYPLEEIEPTSRKIYVKDIEKGKDYVNYKFIYRSRY